MVHAKSFVHPDEVEEAARIEVEEKYFPKGLKGTKQNNELRERTTDALRKVESESKILKRRLEQNGLTTSRKTGPPDGNAPGELGESADGIHRDWMDPVLYLC